MAKTILIVDDEVSILQSLEGILSDEGFETICVESGALALEKIEDGIYGECESCGEDIGMKRLEARPVAELCIDCKSEQEKLERREV